MRYDLLATLLTDAGLGTPGEDLYIHRMPFEVDTGVLIRGPLDGIPTDFNIPGYFKAKIQVIVRDRDQLAGDTKAGALYKLLTIYNKVFGTNMTIKQMYPCNLPVVYPRSEGEGLEWSLTFDTVFTVPVL